tara:strand:- start:232 stop:1083 length:852 start_codon:yes stop_codon:yes gene_type:complete
MSKGGGGGGSTTQTQKSEPWIGQQPYLTDLYRQAQTQFQQGPQQFYPGRTYAEASPTVYQAENLQRQAALAQAGLGLGSIVPGFQQALMSPAQRFQDPMLQEALTANLRPIEETGSRLLQQARRQATGKGQLGGTRQAILESEVIKDITQKQADVARQMYGDVYGDVLKSQAVTLGLSGDIMRTFGLPAATLGQVGAAETARAQQPITEAMQRFAFGQAAPSQALQQYGNIVAGTILPGTVTSTGGGGGGPSTLQSGIGGAATGYAMGGLPGAAVGGILGLLS